ncbi:LapA family protein [Coleofasciculus chthonoplastes]|jgi:uncharacterized integral membrane protein|uniref:LapA family protein n=1 Tax=Coleofasciculus TaxID=669368 RepID=UPI0032FB2F70
MKALTNLLTSLIVAAWIAAIAILSVQNATLVSLRFLNVESIKLPVGIVLALSVGIGLIVGAIIPWVWQIESRRQQ